MNVSLKKMTQEWMQLERKTIEQRKVAEDFCEKNLMNLIDKDYHVRNKKKLFEKVDFLIMTVGTSYEPLVLNINLLKPSRILFLYTERSEWTLEKVVNQCNLSVKSYEKRRVQETDPLTLYQRIKDSYIEWGNP